MTRPYVPRIPSLPLPGRPCRVRWLEPMPEGWSVRSDGLFFLFCRGDDLAAFVPVLSARDRVRDLFQRAVSAEISEDQQAIRLMVKVTADLWGHPMGRVMYAVGRTMGLFFMEGIPTRAERNSALMDFFQLVGAAMGEPSIRITPRVPGPAPVPAAGDGKAH